MAGGIKADLNPGEDLLLEQLLRIEERCWWSHYLGDAAAFYRDELLAEGAVITRLGIFEHEASAEIGWGCGRWTAFTVKDARLPFRSDDAAVLVYTAVLTTAEDHAALPLAVSSTYLPRDGRWRLLLQHVSALPAAA
jgi:hypothetical protein